MLNPRFYTTDFDEMDRIDVSAVRAEWDELIAEMKSDPNKGHFKKNADWDTIDLDALPEALRKEFIDFLVSSLTAEFSGCVLYKEMKRRGTNPDICELFSYMSRDEARHAGFINDALREVGIAVNLGFLTKAKKYTYFQPKFIYYATYLSEKIGYARYITIFRHLEAQPRAALPPDLQVVRGMVQRRVPPRRGLRPADALRSAAAFGLATSYWIKFFLIAVFATMYVRDHARPEFHKALGVDIEDYDMKVFRLTSEISRQVFPLVLDLDDPRLMQGFRALKDINDKAMAAEERGGVGGWLGKKWHTARAAFTFARLYFVPSVSNAIPATSRLEPVW